MAEDRESVTPTALDFLNTLSPEELTFHVGPIQRVNPTPDDPSGIIRFMSSNESFYRANPHMRQYGDNWQISIENPEPPKDEEKPIR
jgi:hypothetical protein